MIYLPHSPFSFLCHRRRAQRGTESGLVWGSSSFVSCFKSHSTYWKAAPDFYFPSPERETVTSLSLSTWSVISVDVGGEHRAQLLISDQPSLLS